MKPRREISEKERGKKKTKNKASVGEDLIKWGMNSTRQTVDSLTPIMNVPVFFSLPFPFLLLFFFLSTYHEIPYRPLYIA